MNEKKNGISKLRISGGVFAVTLIAVLAFYIHGAFMPEGLEYRVGIQNIAAAIAAFVVPTAFSVFAFLAIWHNWHGRATVLRTIGTILLALAVCAYFMTATALYVVYIWAQPEEITYKPGILITEDRTIFGDRRSCTFERKINFFLKESYEPISDVVLLLLEDKYGQSFMLEEDMDDYYIVYPQELPEILFCAELEKGMVSDDYVTVYATKFFAGLTIDRSIVKDEEEYYGGTRFLVECSGVTDLESCAEDLETLINAISENPQFEQTGWSVSFAVECYQNEFLYDVYDIWGVTEAADIQMELEERYEWLADLHGYDKDWNEKSQSSDNP